MRVAVAVESARSTAEATIGYAFAGRGEPSVRATGHAAKKAGATITPPHKTHRYRADRGGTHHGQDDAARAFHGVASGEILRAAGQAGLWF